MQFASRVRVKEMPSEMAKEIIENTSESRTMEPGDFSSDVLKRRRRPAPSPRLGERPTNTLSSQPISTSKPARRKQEFDKDRQTR